MIDATTLIAELKELGINLRVDGDNLVARYPDGSMTDKIASTIIACKPAIVAHLKSRHEAHCPWCKSTHLEDGPSGAWCLSCGKLAWRQLRSGDVINVSHEDSSSNFDAFRLWLRSDN